MSREAIPFDGIFHEKGEGAWAGPRRHINNRTEEETPVELEATEELADVHVQSEDGCPRRIPKRGEMYNMAEQSCPWVERTRGSDGPADPSDPWVHPIRPSDEPAGRMDLRVGYGTAGPMDPWVGRIRV